MNIEIKRINENEYWIGKNRTVLSCKNIFYVDYIAKPINTAELIALIQKYCRH